jgi:hypothetical protein
MEETTWLTVRDHTNVAFAGLLYKSPNGCSRRDGFSATRCPAAPSQWLHDRWWLIDGWWLDDGRYSHDGRPDHGDADQVARRVPPQAPPLRGLVPMSPSLGLLAAREATPTLPLVALALAGFQAGIEPRWRSSLHGGSQRNASGHTPTPAESLNARNDAIRLRHEGCWGSVSSSTNESRPMETTVSRRLPVLFATLSFLLPSLSFAGASPTRRSLGSQARPRGPRNAPT